MHSVTSGLLLKSTYCSLAPTGSYDKDVICPVNYNDSFYQGQCKPGHFPTMALYAVQDTDHLFQHLLMNGEDYIPVEPLGIILITFYFISAFFSGSMISAGLFIPNMISGAALGRFIAVSCRAIFLNNCYAEPMRCAFFASAALLSSVIRLTFSLAVIYCEGASNTILFFPIVIVLLTVKIISDIIIPGIYEVQSELASVPILPRHAPPLAMGLNALDVMATGVVHLPSTTSARRLIQVSFETRHNGFPVVDTKFTSKFDDTLNSVGRLEGLILRSQILIILKNQWLDAPTSALVAEHRLSVFRRDFANLLSHATVGTKPGLNVEAPVSLSPYMDTSPFTVKTTCSLNRAYRLFAGIGLRHLIVTNNTNEVVGLITRKDLAQFKVKVNVTGFSVETKAFN